VKSIIEGHVKELIEAFILALMAFMIAAVVVPALRLTVKIIYEALPIEPLFMPWVSPLLKLLQVLLGLIYAVIGGLEDLEKTIRFTSAALIFSLLYIAAFRDLTGFLPFLVLLLIRIARYIITSLY